MENSDRAKLEQVAKGYNDLMALQAQKNATVARMIRACMQRINTNDTKQRREGYAGLKSLAEMLEREATKTTPATPE